MGILHFIQTSWVGWFVLLSAKATLLLAIALGVHALVKRSSASFRHSFMTIALIMIFLLPIASMVLPTVKVLSYQNASEYIKEQIASQRNESLDPVPQETVPLEHLDHKQITAVNENNFQVWVNIFLGVYTLGLVVIFFRIMTAFVWTRWLRRIGQPVSEDDYQIKQIALDVSREVGIRTSVNIIYSHKLSIPIVCGWFKPVILLPVDSMYWSTSQLKSVLLHEFAHIKRHDELISTIIHVLSVWQWFNPLVWIAIKRCNGDRERACDDFVISAGIQNIDYANHLVMVGKSAALSKWLVPTGLAMTRKHNIEKRLVDILDTTKNRRQVSLAKIAISVLIIFSLVAPVASLSGKPQELLSQSIPFVEKDAVITTIRGFLDALSDGDDYKSIKETYLSSSYFNQSDLTMENREASEWDMIRKRMMSSLYNNKILFHPIATADIKSITQGDGKFKVTLLMNVFNDTGSDSGVYFVKNLESTIEMTEENGKLKVSRIDGGLSVMRMDINNPYGPIFLVWMNDMGSSITPYGPFIIKIIPASIRDDNTYALYFELEE